MRVGQKNDLVYQWAVKGTRPRQPQDQRYENAYLFGAFCAERNAGAALILPHADTEAMQLHLEEIGRSITPGAHGLVVLDKAGWHTTKALKPPSIFTLLPLPPAFPALIRRKTSGNLCGKPISQRVCLIPITTSSMPSKMLGVNLPKRSVAFLQ